MTALDSLPLVLDVFEPSRTSLVVRVGIAVALGLFLGLEREWSQKPAGIRTFALISVLGTIFAHYDGEACAGDGPCTPLLAAVGAVFVVLIAAGLVYSGVDDEEGGLHLTTAVSMLVAYGVGLLVSVGAFLPATVVTVTSSLLLVFKRELHGFAWGLSRDEMHSATEFAILAFVVYPLLPAGTVEVGPPQFTVALEPRVVWLMVVFVAGVGIVNYAVVRTYGGRGVAVTGFFGGLASSTAVVGTMLDNVSQRPAVADYAVAAILLADAAMALRNLLVALVFTVPDAPLVGAVVPLTALLVASVAVAAYTADWREQVDFELESPFSMRNVLGFGALFLGVVAVGSVAGAAFGTLGFYATAAVTGLVSSAGATTSAVVLYRNGALAADAAIVSIVLATGASVVVKGGLAAASPNRAFARRVVGWSALLLAVAAGASALVLA